MYDIIESVFSGSMDTIRRLLKSDPSLVTARNDNFETPLHIAVKRGDIEIASLLINAKANVDAVDIDGASPLINAVCLQHSEIAGLILNAGANVNTRLKGSGRTALHIAALNGDTDSISLLLHYNSDPHALDNWGEGEPVDIAIESGNLNILDQLKDYISPSIFVSIIEEDIKQLTECIETGYNPEIERPSGDIPLHWATILGHIDIVDKLIKISPIDHQNRLGKTPLMYAVWLTYHDIIQLLLLHGANTNISDTHGYTALSWAARDNQEIGVITTLLQNGANPNYVSTMSGESPIHTWAQFERPDIIELLLKSGANPDARDYNRKTPLHIAAENSNTAVVQELVIAGAQPDKRDVYGYTPLHKAVLSNCVEIVEILLKKGIDPNTETDDGQTPLEIAKEEGYSQIETILRTF